MINFKIFWLYFFWISCFYHQIGVITAYRNPVQIRWLKQGHRTIFKAAYSHSYTQPPSMQKIGHFIANVQSCRPYNFTAPIDWLLSLGRSWVDHEDAHDTSEWIRVPGCSTLIDLRIEKLISGNTCDRDQPLILLDGHTESIIHKGVLKLIIEGFNSSGANEILAHSSSEWLAKAGLKAALPYVYYLVADKTLQTIQMQVRAIVSTDGRHKDVISDTIPKAAEIIPPADEHDNSYDLPIHNSEAIANLVQCSPSEISNFPSDRNAPIAVLLSGGVDSAVSLLLLHQIWGYTNITAYYIKIWLEDETSGSITGECPWKTDLQFVQQTIELLNRNHKFPIALEVVDLQKEYYDRVIAYALSELRCGRTPNPDIMCNSMIKFGVFYDRFGKLYERVATGHYAQVRREGDNSKKVQLVTTKDPIKDQTYFLSYLKQSQLQKAIFPIGNFSKPEVRLIAKTFALPPMLRKDSQGICFLGKLKFNDFLAHHLGHQHGYIRDAATSRVIGEHKGLWFHTIGQRKGLGPLLYNGDSNRGPWFVAYKNTTSNELVVSNRIINSSRESRYCDNDLMRFRKFRLNAVNWVGEKGPLELRHSSANIQEPYQCMVKLRHSPMLHSCRVSVEVGNDGEDHLEVTLSRPDDGLSNGQYAALYKGNVCLGSGKICTDY